MKILITGGAGFVGSNLAIKLKRKHPDYRIFSLDNLKRRGSELSIPRLKDAQVTFVHGDIRNPEDFEQLETVDLILECSAEPSVQAGYQGGARYLVNTNLTGTVNCLEFARRSRAAMIFFSTSRVYPIQAMRKLPLAAYPDRLDIPESERGQGWSSHGINTDFPLEGSRSLYGSTKLCAELLIEEYREMFGLQTVINRCGVITGPWQMGKVDQGFVTLWASRHFFGGNLAYIGFGGRGLQVRDILHIDDLYDLVELQLTNLTEYNGNHFNVGGGYHRSVSLRELTKLCREMTNKSIEIGCVPDTHPADIPYYISDNQKVSEITGWKPQKSIEATLDDIFGWMRNYRQELKKIFFH
jgi:CDP-paratose 2-epimerase